MTRIWTTVLVLLFGLALGRDVLAAESKVLFPASDKPRNTRRQKEQSKIHFEKGRDLFRAGDFQKAADEFVASYEISNDPALLYNIGRCYEELGNDATAITYYQGYIEKAPAAPDAQEVRQRIADMQAEAKAAEEARIKKEEEDRRHQAEAERLAEIKEAQNQAIEAEKAKAAEAKARKEATEPPDYAFDARLGGFAELTDNLPSAFVFDANYFLPLGLNWDFVPGFEYQGYGRKDGIRWDGYGVNLGFRKLWILGTLISLDLRASVVPVYMSRSNGSGFYLGGRVSSRVGFRVHKNVVLVLEPALFTGPLFDLDSNDIAFSIGIMGLAGVEVWFFD